jgi:hypothetical protein
MPCGVGNPDNALPERLFSPTVSHALPLYLIF